MIAKFRRRFILLAMVTQLLLLVAIVCAMNLLNYQAITSEADAILLTLAQNQGAFPEPASANLGQLPPDKAPNLPPFSAELPYESRYFSIFYNEAGEVVAVDVAHIASVDREGAISLANEVRAQSAEKPTTPEAGGGGDGAAVQRRGVYGMSGSYRYLFSADPKGERVTFLDCRRQLDQFRRAVATSAAMAAVGYGVVSLVIVAASRRLVKPLEEAQRKQVRFITDASHELRTPLAIILANADLLSLDDADSESVQDIKSQVRRMEALTDDLVALARLEEASDGAVQSPQNLSQLVAEAVKPYEALASQQDKRLQVEATPDLWCRGEAQKLSSLVGILLDNAFKYSPEHSVVSVSVANSDDPKMLSLEVANATNETLDPARLSALFDRFYRADESRTSETGGYGLGLSIAQATVKSLGGTICALAPEKHRFLIQVRLPLAAH